MMGTTGSARAFGWAILIGCATVAFGAQSPAQPRNGRNGEGPAKTAASGDALRAELQGFLDEQAAAWTRGDLDAFCASYAEDATFVSPTTGITHGRDEVLARYRHRYPTRDAMGALSLEVLEVRAAPVGLDSTEPPTTPSRSRPRWSRAGRCATRTAPRPPDRPCSSSTAPPPAGASSRTPPSDHPQEPPGHL